MTSSNNDEQGTLTGAEMEGEEVTVTLLQTLIPMDPMDRIELLRAGIESVVLIEIARAIGRSAPELIELLQLARRSPVVAVQQGARLTTEQSERVLAFLRLIEIVEDMVMVASSEKAFNAPRWIGDWLATPCPALGGRRPATLTDTIEGFRVLGQMLSQILSGAYA